MSRRHRAERREINPDAKYGNLVKKHQRRSGRREQVVGEIPAARGGHWVQRTHKPSSDAVIGKRCWDRRRPGAEIHRPQSVPHVA